MRYLVRKKICQHQRDQEASKDKGRKKSLNKLQVSLKHLLNKFQMDFNNRENLLSQNFPKRK